MAHFRYMTTHWHRLCRVAALAVVAFALAACGADGAPQNIHITGELKLPATATLSKDVTAEVSLVQLPAAPKQVPDEPPPSSDEEPVEGQRIVAKQTMHEPGSMPVSFDLEVARALLAQEGRYALTARIESAKGQPLWQTRAPLVIDPDQTLDGFRLMLARSVDKLATASAQ